MGKQVAARLKQNNFNIPNGGVAQLGEHLPCKQGVKSSNLSISIRVHDVCTSRTSSFRSCRHADTYLENRILKKIYSSI